nr:cysteine--tRNA ligase [Streptococcus sp. S784/96/1]
MSMTIKIYDTMTRSLREFVPLEEGKVKMYVCGPTVYNYIHVGNGRSAVAFDTIRRYLEYRGFDVTYVSNFTDVDDKIIHGAAREGLTTKDFSDKYIAAFMEDTAALGIKPATKNPRVIDYMDEIIAFVADLVEKGFAYESEGDVYFRVEKSVDYAKLANKTLADLVLGASGRTDEETDRKESPVDFALWKSAKAGEVSWESPWGAGRPGWHIECSVMATEILGDTIDIHGGGADLEFPHHTNEIAQSEAKTGHKFVNYWMHNGFVNVDNEKMSKSLGNFITIHDALKTVDGQVLRFFLAIQQYRKPINFTEKAIHDAQANLKYLKNTYEQPFTGQVNADELVDFVAKFTDAMDEDFNTANGITVVFEMAKWINSGNYDKSVKAELTKMLEVFGIVFKEEVLDTDIERLIEERQAARANRDFATADRIRDELATQGIKLLDTKDGVRWTRD